MNSLIYREEDKTSLRREDWMIAHTGRLGGITVDIILNTEEWAPNLFKSRIWQRRPLQGAPRPAERGCWVFKLGVCDVSYQQP
jgi:hypothetical protein